MNKLLFNEGGQPLYLDDIAFLQSAFSDCIKGMISTYGNVILSGCSVTYSNGKANWEEGYISLNGEIYKVNAGSITAAESDQLFWVAKFSEEQKEIFENSSEHNVYQYGIARIETSASESEVYAAKEDVKTMEEILIGKVDKAFESPMKSKYVTISGPGISELKCSQNKSCIHYEFSFNSAMSSSISLENGYWGEISTDGLSRDIILNMPICFMFSFSQRRVGGTPYRKAVIVENNNNKLYFYDINGNEITTLPGGLVGTVHLTRFI